ncbi:hypothetical protein D0Q02_05450 [Micromonospora craniellae]|uniref:Uncharacterized protein n=1 Tax=Micromonospora craniellae TaxID=2294034 RepID=A0A372G322_9ACTN|nr:hypothetical protein D0Q02_05450 [Micromonospora craniellae]
MSANSSPEVARSAATRLTVCQAYGNDSRTQATNSSSPTGPDSAARIRSGGTVRDMLLLS